MSNNKDIETNTNENTQKSETPKKKNIVHVFRPQNTQNGGNKGRRSGGNRQNSGQGKQMQANNGRPAKRPAAQNTATGEAQAPKRTERPAAERAQGRQIRCGSNREMRTKSIGHHSILHLRQKTTLHYIPTPGQ